MASHRGRYQMLAAAFWLGLLIGSQAPADEPQPPPGENQLPAGENQLPVATRWFKGNLHTHSLWSDGNNFPEMIADWYRERGYHFLALSDHNILSEGAKWLPVAEVTKRSGHDALAPYRRRFGADWCETRTHDGQLEVRLKPLGEFRPLVEEADRFLLIQSEEITDHFGPLPVHINAHNLRDMIRPQGGASVRETIANNLSAVERQGERTGRPMFAHLNHPNYEYGVSAEDLAAVLEEHYFEVYNGHPAVHQQGDAEHPSVERMWDIANTIRLAQLGGPPLFGLATDDAHEYFGRAGASPGRGWVQVRAARLTPESLIAAIRQGEFYASSGVTLDDVQFDPMRGIVEVHIHPEGDAQFTTRFIGTRRPVGADKPAPAAADRQPPAADKPSGKAAAELPPAPPVGEVLATVSGTTARYMLAGDEWYVRATITSNKPPANPSFKEQTAQAWTQPVGWQKWLPAAAPAEPKAE